MTVAAAQLGFVVVLAVDALVVLVFLAACADHDIIWHLAYFRNSIFVQIGAKAVRPEAF